MPFVSTSNQLKLIWDGVPEICSIITAIIIIIIVNIHMHLASQKLMIVISGILKDGKHLPCITPSLFAVVSPLKEGKNLVNTIFPLYCLLYMQGSHQHCNTNSDSKLWQFVPPYAKH